MKTLRDLVKTYYQGNYSLLRIRVPLPEVEGPAPFLFDSDSDFDFAPELEPKDKRPEKENPPPFLGSMSDLEEESLESHLKKDKPSFSKVDESDEEIPLPTEPDYKEDKELEHKDPLALTKTLNPKENPNAALSKYSEIDVFFHANPELSELSIPDSITSFLEKLRSQRVVNEDDFIVFHEWFKVQSPIVQDVFINFIYMISLKIYNEYQIEIHDAIRSIETSLATNKEIPQYQMTEQNYIGLFNCMALFNTYSIPIQQNQSYVDFPGIPFDVKDIVRSDIPFAINALRLVGKLPKDKPIYPLDLNISEKDRITERIGIKNSDLFFPYKNVKKIAEQPSDNVFLMTNGKKQFFVRAKPYSSRSLSAVLASEIAKLIDKECFASESLFTNLLVGSKKLKSYEIPLTASGNLPLILRSPTVHLGAAKADEVTNFIGEEDHNLENYALSPLGVSKIDFDRCDMISPLSKEKYKKDIFTRTLTEATLGSKSDADSQAAALKELGITTDYTGSETDESEKGVYESTDRIQEDPDYIKEKLYVRLKLSMMPNSLIKGLVNKACALRPQDEPLKEKAVIECSNRRDIAFQLFLEESKKVDFFSKNAEMIDQCYKEILTYVEERKFEERELIKNDLLGRCKWISQQIVTPVASQEGPESPSSSPSPHPSSSSIKFFSVKDESSKDLDESKPSSDIDESKQKSPDK